MKTEGMFSNNILLRRCCLKNHSKGPRKSLQFPGSNIVEQHHIIDLLLTGDGTTAGKPGAASVGPIAQPSLLHYC